MTEAELDALLTDPESDRVERKESLSGDTVKTREPIFHLRSADGALGAHAKAAKDARGTFERLARRMAERSWAPADRARVGWPAS